MANVYKRWDGRSPFWQFDYVDEFEVEHRGRSTKIRNRRDAQTFADKENAAARVRRITRRDGGIEPHPFSEVVAEYRLKRLPELKGRVSLDSRLRRWERRFGKTPIEEINFPNAVDTYWAERRGDVTGWTIENDIVALRAVISAAVAWGYLEKDKLEKRRKRAKAPRRRRRRCLDEAESDRLVIAARDSSNPSLAALIVLGLRTAGRLGEMLAMKWANVHIDRRDLPAKDRKSTVTFPAEDTKTGEPRLSPIDDATARVLDALPRTSDFVFTTKTGARLRDVRTIFHAARKRAGLGKDVTMHVLRHTFATHIARRVPLPVAMALTGHKDVGVFLIYQHVGEDEKREGMDGYTLGHPGPRPVEGADQHSRSTRTKRSK